MIKKKKFKLLEKAKLWNQLKVQGFPEVRERKRDELAEHRILLGY